MIGMPLLALRRDNGRERLRVILPRICRLPRPADNCHSNKYPLWVSAIDENARSLRPDDWRVNPCKEVCREMLGMFRKGSEIRFFLAIRGPIAGKPAPTGISSEHKFCVQHRSCGSWLASDGGVSGNTESAGSRQQQIRHRPMPSVLAMLIQRAGDLPQGSPVNTKFVSNTDPVGAGLPAMAVYQEILSQLAVANNRSAIDRCPRCLPCSYNEPAISSARIGNTDSNVSLRPWLAWQKPCMYRPALQRSSVISL